MAPLIGLGLNAALGGDHRIDLLGSGLTFDALADLITQRALRVVILDEGPELAENIRALRTFDSDLAIVALLHDPGSAGMSRVFASGATTCLSIDAAPFAVRSAIRFAAEGKKLFARAQAAVADHSQPNIASLTHREREVLELIALGLRRAEIALALGITQHTVATHTQKVFRKMGVSGRDELVGRELPLPTAECPVDRTVTVPARVAAQLRNGLHIVLSTSASEISAVADRAGRDRHPEWYSQPLERLMRTCALLEATGWSDPTEPRAVQVDFAEHRQALLDALELTSSLADAELDELETVDAARIARGEPPKREATLKRFREFHAFAARIHQLASRLDSP